MTPDEQEALSHQHFGAWVVPLESGALAVFTHPSGSLHRILANRDLFQLQLVCEELNRARASTERVRTVLDLGGIDI